MARFLIAAAHKSSGKTTVSIGLAAALHAQGLSVQPFKKGPDYIDPMWLSRAARRPCFNLDYNVMSADEITGAVARRSADADITLIEANKGLFDGVDTEGRDSNAALAKLLKAPVVLVIDTEGMTRGIAPLVLGYVNFDPDVAIKGVILNRVGSPRHEGKLRAALERYTDIDVLGAVPRDKSIEITERHLGLTTPGEVGALDDRIKNIADVVRGGVDLARLQAIAAAAPALTSPPGETNAGQGVPGPAAGLPVPDLSVPDLSVRIAIAQDSAFGFYYPDDLEALRDAGAELLPFDTLRDKDLPEADGLFIGGGFPETHMSALCANTALRGAIKRAIEAGLPAYAECGGLMYLSRSLSWDGACHEMAGVIPGDAVMHARPRGRGLVRLGERLAMPWPGLASQADTAPEFAAHEFHYASLENLKPGAVFAYDVLRGQGIDGRHDGIVIYNLLANFSHLRDTAANHWARRFVAFVRSKTKAR